MTEQLQLFLAAATRKAVGGPDYLGEETIAKELREHMLKRGASDEATDRQLQKLRLFDYEAVPEPRVAAPSTPAPLTVAASCPLTYVCITPWLRSTVAEMQNHSLCLSVGDDASP